MELNYEKYKINGIETEYYDLFLGCSLEGNFNELLKLTIKEMTTIFKQFNAKKYDGCYLFPTEEDAKNCIEHLKMLCKLRDIPCR